MTGENFVSLEKLGTTCLITLKRPNVLNAMHLGAWIDLKAKLIEATSDLDTRVAIVLGEGRCFCVGADLGELHEHAAQIESGELNAATLRELQKTLQDTTRLIRRARFPFIAAVQGHAVGAGCEIALACDFIVAASDARFGFPEAGVGVTITNGGTFLLPRIVGLSRARELAYLGEFIDAEEAKRIGMVSRVVPESELRQVAIALADRIATRAPSAIELHKTMIDRALESSLEASLVYETECLVATATSLDHREGARAFKEKRSPRYNRA